MLMKGMQRHLDFLIHVNQILVRQQTPAEWMLACDGSAGQVERVAGEVRGECIPE